MEKELKPLHDLRKRTILIDPDTVDPVGLASVGDQSSMSAAPPSVAIQTATPQTASGLTEKPTPAASYLVKDSPTVATAIPAKSPPPVAVVRLTPVATAVKSATVNIDVPKTAHKTTPLPPELEISQKVPESKPEDRPPKIAMSGTVGLANYHLTAKQSISIVLWMTLLAVLGGVLAILTAAVVAFGIYKHKTYSIVPKQQYRVIIKAMILANSIGLLLFAGLFSGVYVFRTSFSGYYVLSFLLTLGAQGLVGVAKAAQFNYRTEYHDEGK